MERRHKKKQSGFSLVELMLAMSITLGIGIIVFQMFLQNEGVFQDQTMVMEMQQSVRAVASMIADEARLAGQGVPVYSAAQDTTTVEAAQVFLDGTDSDDLRFRAGIRNAATTVTTPLVYSGTTTVTVADVSGINAIVGTDADYFVYLWGPTGNTWTWLRGEVSNISTGSNQLDVALSQNSGQGATFSSAPRLALEEGISYRLNSGSVMRGTTTDFSNLTAPTFSEQTIGTNFTALTFTYYDAAGATVSPTTLALRSTIRRVDLVVGAQTSGTLSGGSVDNFAITLSVYPRNLAVN